MPRKFGPGRILNKKAPERESGFTATRVWEMVTPHDSRGVGNGNTPRLERLLATEKTKKKAKRGTRHGGDEVAVLDF